MFIMKHRTGQRERRTATTGRIVSEDNTRYYRISDYDLMDPFFIALVGDGDLWMYISSNGSLAAGRCSPEGSLFPYESVDKIHVRHGHTGPLTIVRVGGGLWDPFDERGRERHRLTRNVLKSEIGNEIIFEEVNHDLGLEFRIRWAGCDRFGWVRTCRIRNPGKKPRRLDVLDGVRNLMPADLGRGTQETMSILGDAHKLAEYDPAAGLAVYGMTGGMSDRPEASESMKATTAWIAGPGRPAVLLSEAQVRPFRYGDRVRPEAEMRGRKAAFLAVATLNLKPGGATEWHQVFDIGLDHSRVAELHRLLKSSRDRAKLIGPEIAAGTRFLRELLSGADAAQLTADEVASVHHSSNVLFNIARGGVPRRNYEVDRSDFASFLAVRNRPLRDTQAGWVESLPPILPLADMIERAVATGNAGLVRHAYEYLPLVFSRRHGDPSRPWNHFAIHMRNPDGSPLYAFQGNWRDVFQNWEALAASFPELLESMIAKFVNASTVDGYNAYRISQAGIDWEVPNPDDPGGNIGYWGDHQIIYLTKLLEASAAHHPGTLRGLLARDWFCYADVPYDIKPHDEMVRDPHFTINFNRERADESARRVSTEGTDGKLWHENGAVYHVNLVEKLLVPVLAKLSSLVPGAGIWLNTQRPEWNDSNNALAGNGVSVVTLAYLRRHLGLLSRAIASADWSEVPVSQPVVDWLREVGSAFDAERETGRGAASDAGRRDFLDAVGKASTRYREAVRTTGFGRRAPLGKADIVSFLEAATIVIEASLKANRRSDGLYHSYNIFSLGQGVASVGRLPEMLEGQVAVLSSGTLSGAESIALLDSLRSSRLYRKDQNTYILFPEKRLPLFRERNVVSGKTLARYPRLAALLNSADNGIVLKDAEGAVRFAPALTNRAALDQALAGRGVDDATRNECREAYEAVFRHSEFTGRGGAMYAFEGIRCVYWHMVAKLLLAVEECFFRARDAGESPAVVKALKRHYRAVRSGLGFAKTPAEFGAFPLDAYSHTPYAGGARQPGMTGQVKEEVLARMGELGVRVDDGRVRFDVSLLDSREFLRRPADFRYLDLSGTERTVHLAAGSLAFTLCQVPIIYTIASEASIEVTRTGGPSTRTPGDALDPATSRNLFNRTGEIRTVEVRLKKSAIA